MPLSESNVSQHSEVMVVSSDSGPLRLDLALTRGRRGTFSSFDSDGERLFPRTKSSNDLFAQALSRVDTVDSDPEWGVVRARARENSDREGLSELIDFFRTTSPPPEFPEQSVFDDDDNDDEPQEEPERWGLFKRLRRSRARARSESPVRRPQTSRLPNAAVASKTTSGKAHIAISIPLEYCHVGPDSDWALAIFNATPPLPPTPPVRKSDVEAKSISRHYASDRNVTVLRAVSEKNSISTINTDNTMSTTSPRRCKGVKGSVSIWPKINPGPLSPPRTPYTTPPGSLRSKASSVSKKRGRLPLPPPQYAELPASPVIIPQTPDENVEKGSFSSDSRVSEMNSSPPKPKAKHAARRPENITLPIRKSSIKIVRNRTDVLPDNQRSIDVMIGGTRKRQSVSFDGPQPSPGAYSEAPSLSSSIATTELSEPVISSARSAKHYSTASIVLQDTSSTRTPSSNAPSTPRPSFSVRPGSSDTTQTTLVNESVASRNPSTRTVASRQSRRDRVKSLKQRDMEALRALTSRQPEEDGEITPRPTTSDTVISSLRLPSRDGTFGSVDNALSHGVEAKLSATNLANMAKAQQTSSNNGSNGTTSKISDWQATQQVETPGWETAREDLTPGWETALETPDWLNTPLLDDITASTDTASTLDNSTLRDSTISSEPPRRWGSYHRTSWASPVPLLDRVGSFAPSDATATRMGEAVNDGSPLRSTRMSRADSATLSQIDADRLTSPRMSISSATTQPARPPMETEQSISGSIAAFPKPGSGSRLSGIMPVAEVIPTLPVDERWSASTLNSPMTVVEVSHPSFVSTQTPEQSSIALARPHTAGNMNPALFNTALDDEQTTVLRRRAPTPEDGDADETATLRPKSRSREDDSLDLMAMSARDLRNHYAQLRSARVSDLAHEMLLNQERLELRMHQQEMNQMLFIERLERCMLELRSLPSSPFLSTRALEWPSEDDLVYEEERISRDSQREVRIRRTARLPSRTQQHQPESSERARRWLGEGSRESAEFESDLYGMLDRHNREQRRSRRPSTSHNTASSRRSGTGAGAGSRGRRRGGLVVPSLPPLSRGLYAMDPLMRELQLASRVSQETNRTERTDTPQPGDPNEYYYNLI